MSSKTDYAPEEWELLQTSILEAGAAMIALQTGGMVRESLALFRALDEAREHHPADSLIYELANEDTEPYATNAATAEESEQPTYMENVRAMLSMLEQAVRLLEQKATAEELDEYRRLVMDIVDRVARASRTGGIFGIGGKPINEEEAELIAQIQAHLQPTG